MKCKKATDYSMAFLYEKNILTPPSIEYVQMMETEDLLKNLKPSNKTPMCLQGSIY